MLPNVLTKTSTTKGGKKVVHLSLCLLAIKSIFQSLKMYSAAIAVIIIATFIWSLQQYSIINVREFAQAGWAATMGLGLLIWLSLNVSIIWKKLTAVYTIDMIKENQYQTTI